MCVSKKLENNCVEVAENTLRNIIEDSKQQHRNKKEAIMKLKEIILEARKNGQTWDEIITALKSSGICVSAFYLRTCLQLQTSKTLKAKAKNENFVVKEKLSQPLEKKDEIVTSVSPSQNRVYKDTAQF